jgi:flagellar biosynthesis protein FlhG
MVNVVADVGVVVIHAEARVLARMLGDQPLRPILMASGASESLTHAYAALKLLVQRLGLMSFDLVTPGVKGRGPTPAQIARRVSDCADRFLGAAMHDAATIDPTVAFGEVAGPDLMRLATAQLSIPVPAPAPAPAAPARVRASVRAAAPSSYLSA